MLHHIELDKYQLPDIYKRNSQGCFLDPLRKKLIQITPEEIVRQSFIQFINIELGVPLDAIEVEVPMTYFKRGAKGRADIIVYDNQRDIPILIIECKAKGVPLIDEVYDQVMDYDDIVLAGNIVVTNGTELEFLGWNNEEKSYYSLLQLPTYKDLLENNLVVDTSPMESWKRPKFEEIWSNEVIASFVDCAWVGEGTFENNKQLLGFIVNLIGCVQDDSITLEPQYIGDIKLIKDGGNRFTSYGNVAGGNFPGSYRYFIIEDDGGNNQLISISIMGTLKSVNDPVFGNRKGHTTLNVAIDDYEISHFALELNLDNYMTVSGEKFKIWHSGALTVGRLGSVKRHEVINFVKQKAPELIDDENRIFLGEFDNSKELTVDSQSFKHFLSRLIKYSLIRDEFRQIYKMKKS
ncbi:type I restriction enzyme HsdR N-terminal domain-containing protein [Brevibacillus sp. AY1]|uniref:type I restriction enzyme HsdR N-terminal domain-containing protein n=1 Tax=Brevibacillus sp. AY1 TaxID=2807621 RepID=UPI00245806EB|nr:type I restriction enzyme HsdR N-terminal domain-containing protein [Brevibacillus sp. AY1]MDH4619954.1 type I restriction enzyme HsdR N-terminal domain-containing protein [Brevibacillus sp. AY1]